MPTNPEAPRPPAPPQPPSKGGHAVAIAILLLALIVVGGITAVLAGLRFLAHGVHVQVDQAGGKKEVSIQTPLGSMAVHQNVDEAGLGLPLYPGAMRLKDHDSATVDFNIANQANFRVLAAKYETSDSLDKVAAFYHRNLDDQVTKFREKNEEGKTVFEIKHDKQDKVVALKSEGDKTLIELVRVGEGDAPAN